MPDDIDLASEREEARRQEAIAAAVTRKGAPSTGVCSIRADRIESDRIKAVPDARHCSECAAAVEEDRARMMKVGR